MPVAEGGVLEGWVLPVGRICHFNLVCVVGLALAGLRVR